MAILEYIPPIKKVIDKRNDKGDYYKALCDVCGTEFYPKRRSAKYCTPNCKVIQHRIDLANGKIPKEIKKGVKISKIKTENTIRGCKNVYQYLKSKYNTRGDREYILNILNALHFGETFNYGETKIKRISAMVYDIK
jgi:hypothetical protein